MIETKIGAGLFTYQLYRDSGSTGTLEVTLYLNSSGDIIPTEGAIVIHSKKASGEYVYSDYDGFLNKL